MLLKIKQVAAYLSCSPSVVYEHIREKRLAVVRVGASKGYRIDTAEIERFLTERTEETEPGPSLRDIMSCQ